MPFQIVRNDITKMHVDAIVNAANSSLLGGGGVDGAIHRAAGPALLEECRTLHGCSTGQAKITGGYNLPAKYVIHTVGPVWQGGGSNEAELLAGCYRNSLELAAETGCGSVAFPLISAGAYGYPKPEALDIAVKSIEAFLDDHDMDIYLVVFDRTSFQLSRDRMQDIREYIDQRYVDAHPADRSNRNIWAEMGYGSAPPAAQTSPQSAPPLPKASRPNSPRLFKRKKSQDRRQEKAGVGSPYNAPHAAPPSADEAPAYESAYALKPGYPLSSAQNTQDLADILSRLDEGFSPTLLHLIDQKGMTDAQCYKKANIDRKLFSKIRGDAHYQPSKPTAIAFAIALELSLPEARDFLARAGYALSPSSKFDMIIEYFILHQNYNIFEINEALFAFDQNLLGAS